MSNNNTDNRGEMGEPESQQGVEVPQESGKGRKIIISILLPIIIGISITIYNVISEEKPTEPVEYEVYHDKISGCSFSYPREWEEPTEKEMREMMGEQPPEVKEAIEQGIFTFATLVDPSESGALLVITIDFEKMGEPVPVLDEYLTGMMVGAFALEVEDFHLISSEKTKFGGMGTGSEEEAWEVTFEGKQSGDNVKATAIVTTHLSKMYMLFFLCEETAYDTLKPAWDRCRETFTF